METPNINPSPHVFSPDDTSYFGPKKEMQFRETHTSKADNRGFKLLKSPKQAAPFSNLGFSETPNVTIPTVDSNYRGSKSKSKSGSRSPSESQRSSTKVTPKSNWIAQKRHTITPKVSIALMSPGGSNGQEASIAEQEHEGGTYNSS